jgi:hypothetical protein
MIDFIESSPNSSQISKSPAMSLTNFMARLNDQDIQSHVLSILLVCLILTSVAFSLRLLYRLALPRPIPGIPYNEAFARKLLGDVSSMTSHIKNADDTFITYIMESMKTLNAPLIQVFIWPLSSSLLILVDFREAKDILIHRKDFDRSPSLGDLVKGLTLDHHIHLQTNAAWKTQRRLVQDLMTPSFLHNVAAPVIHQHAMLMIELWRAKSRIADGRPWAGNDDINHVALDVVMAFEFGEDFKHSMTRPNLDAVRRLDSKAVDKLRRGDRDEAIEFPKGEIDELIQATLDLTETIEEVQGNPLPALTWAYVNRKPKIKRATKIKEDYIMKELRGAIKRLNGGEKEIVKSAVDHLVLREKELAERDNRTPAYFSRVMNDEVCCSWAATPSHRFSRISWLTKTFLLADLWVYLCRSRNNKHDHLLGPQVPCGPAKCTKYTASGFTRYIRGCKIRRTQPKHSRDHRQAHPLSRCCN